MEGPAAWDMLENFLERMEKQVPIRYHDAKSYIRTLVDSKNICDRSTPAVPFYDIDSEDGLDSLDSSASVTGYHRVPKTREWSCQVFRSIDASSAAFHFGRLPRPEVSDPNFFIDTSVHQAYLYHIHRAQK